MNNLHSAFRRLDLNLLLAFDALYRHRSVSGAAAELAISASAFSHALARLRQSLNDELFIRQGNRMHPTHRADLLAGPVLDALRILADGLNLWEPFDPQRSERTFVFSATDYTSFALMPALMAQLQREAPAVRLRLLQSERKVSIEALAAGRVDFALGYDEEHEALPAGVESLEWLSDDYLVIAASAHPRIAKRLSLDAYLAERHVIATPWNEERGVIDRVLDGMGLARRVALQLPSVLAAPFVVAAGELLMTVPRHAAETLRHAAPIALYPAPFAIPPYTLKLYSHSKYAHSDAHAWMRGRLRALRPQLRPTLPKPRAPKACAP
jgi:DNA-binding transcriptional LysR family regulator